MNKRYVVITEKHVLIAIGVSIFAWWNVAFNGHSVIDERSVLSNTATAIRVVQLIIAAMCLVAWVVRMFEYGFTIKIPIGKARKERKAFNDALFKSFSDAVDRDDVKEIVRIGKLLKD